MALPWSVRLFEEAPEIVRRADARVRRMAAVGERDLDQI
jgi:hypothetical protein